MRALQEKLAQPIQFGKYLLLERLGRGGMAEVWKARITGPAGFARTMVVKRILPQLVEDPSFVQMFVTEARLSARLNHANIVTVFELGEVHGEYFLAMEYVRGHDLMTVLRAHSPRGVPSPGFGAYVLREVARGLGYAHSLTDEEGHPLQLIHRDLSPSNVMLGFDGGIKLLDFGIAKAMAEANDKTTLTGTLKGKLGYMSPEQAEGGEIDHRGDLFSLGVLLFECITGRRLFKGIHDTQTLAQVRATKVPVPSSINAEVPPQLDEICLKALARNPDDRYQSGEELGAALDRVAHQLDWGPERMVTLMRSLFPTEFSLTPTKPRIEEHPLEISVEESQIVRPSRAWLWVTALVVVLAGMALGVWRLTRPRRTVAEEPVIWLPPTPVVKPVVTPTAPVAPEAPTAPAAAPAPAAPTAPATSTSAPPARHKTRPDKPRGDLLKGDFVDPFQ
jgi:serine/threonine protein kinase